MKNSQKGFAQLVLLIISIIVIVVFCVYLYSQNNNQGAAPVSTTTSTGKTVTPSVPQSSTPKTPVTTSPAKTTMVSGSTAITVFAPPIGTRYQVVKTGNWTSVQQIPVVWSVKYSPVKGLFAFLVPTSNPNTSVFTLPLGVTANGGTNMLIQANGLSIPAGSYQIKICDEGNTGNPISNPKAGTMCGIGPVFSIVKQ